MRDLPEEKIIDVVENFQCPNQTPAYRKAFQSWRRRPDNKYAFCFTKNPKETSFSDNHNAVSETPSQAEFAVLTRLGYLIGIALLIFLFAENVLGSILAYLLRAAGLRIETVLWDSSFYGDETLAFWFPVVIRFLKYFLPLLILRLALRLPFRVSVPIHIQQPRELVLGISAIMLLSAGLGTFSIPQSADLEKYRQLSDAVGEPDHRMILYIIITVFLIPLISELMLHGSLFQVLRQFGDTFAIIVTTVLGAMLTHDLRDALRVGIVALLISVYLVRTGSFLTAVLMHIVHEIYMFALFYVATFGTVYSLQWWVTVMLPAIVGLFAGICMLLQKQKKPKTEKPPANETYLSTWDKLTAFFTSVPMILLCIVCVLLTVITTMLF
jgi:hypothetical protein